MEPPWQDLCPLLVLILQWTWVHSTEEHSLHRTTGHSRQEQGRVLTVLTKLDHPYMMLKKESPFLMGNDRFEGYLADLILRLSQAIGFKYRIQLVNDGQYGKQEKDNGSWTGIIGQVAKNEADIGLGPIIVTGKKSRVVQFTTPFISFRSTALLRKPRRRRSRIKTLTELVSRWTIKKGILQGGPTQELFERTGNPTYSRMWSIMTNTFPSVFVHSIEEGADRARREDYAFILDGPKAEYLTYQRPCDLYTIEPFLDMRHYALALPMASSLKRVINSEITRMKRSGQMELIYMRWWRNQCNQRRVTNVRNAKTTNKNKKNRQKSGVTESVARVTAIARVTEIAVVEGKCNLAVSSIHLTIFMVLCSYVI